MNTNLNELEKRLEVKLKKNTRKLFFVGLSLGLAIALTSTVIAVSTIGNHDHFTSQILGANQERLNIDSKKLNAIDCVRSREKSGDDNSTINKAADCWEISNRTGSIAIGAITIVGDVTYTDLRTGFMWTATADADAAVIRLANAYSTCDAAVIRGFSDWRIPTLSEIMEAMHNGLFEVVGGTDEDGDGSFTDNWDADASGSIDSTDALWSSTTNNTSVGSSWVWRVDVMSSISIEDTSSRPVRCVRTAR